MRAERGSIYGKGVICHQSPGFCLCLDPCNLAEESQLISNVFPLLGFSGFSWAGVFFNPCAAVVVD